MLQSFGWIFFVLLGLAVVGLAVHAEIGRRRRASAARRAAWKAHQAWLHSGTSGPAARDKQPAQ